MLIFSAALIAMQLSHPSRLAPPIKLSICELLVDDPTRFNGKVIFVRGHLVGTDEGIWLAGDCKNHLVTKGYTWGDVLWIYIDPSDRNVMRSWQRMSEKIKRLNGNVQGGGVYLTIVGGLETRSSMDEEVGLGPDGPRPVGFGHLNGAPAEINVISVTDVTVAHSRSDIDKTSKHPNPAQ